MLHWLRDRRRAKWAAEPFPAAWQEAIARNVAHWRWLSGAERLALQGLVQVFVREKHWEGCGGLTLDDEIRVTVAAQACLLVLALPHNLYENVESILVYPSTVVPPEAEQGVFVRGPLVPRPRSPRLGEAHHRGPVVLAWDEVKRSGRSARGHNLVFHEFAHKLDMLDDRADGTPPLPDSGAYTRWVEVCAREFLTLRDEVERGAPSLIDDYGATDEAEFFAVATELFFDRPQDMQREHPDLYGVLRDFYRQDPAARRG
jgi:Mlc titration factor MtfA (ptsG expression regulator)